MTGTGIPAGSVVQNVYATMTMLNNAATPTNAAAALTFSHPPRYVDGFTVGWDKADYGNPAFTGYTPPAPDNGLFEMRYA